MRTAIPSVGTTLKVLEQGAEYSVAEYCIAGRISQFRESVD
jgi:hypothetical protein